MMTDQKQSIVTLWIRTLLVIFFDVLVTIFHSLHMCRKHFLLTKSVKSAIFFQIVKNDVSYIE